MTLHSILIQKLLSTNAHLGKRVAEHHFKIYTYGMRNNMAIIDSDKTLICLRHAANFIAQLAREKHARFLFVNTNPLFDEIVEQMTRQIGLYSPRDNIMWRMGGFLTNSFSPKKFRSRNKKLCFGPIQPPDCVVVLDSEKKSSVIYEADRMQIPIVALVNSNTPWEIYKRIAYPVPANDTAEFVYLFCNIITKTFLLEKKKMKALKGDGAKDEPTVSEKESGVEVQQIEQSKSNSSSDEVLIVPYQSLASSFNGIAETRSLLDKLVVVKFNDTLGADMGFIGPKSLIEVYDGLTSLDLIVNQIESLNFKYGCQIPMVLMNTEKTHDDTLKVLDKYSASKVDILSFNLAKNSLQEAFGRQSSDDELYPSGHTPVYISLLKSGLLDMLLSKGKEYVQFLSSDNMAAAVDLNILNHLVQNKIGYCMEVTPTLTDLVRNGSVYQRQGKFQFDEITENPSEQLMEKFKFIDTRSVWVNLKAIRRLADTDATKMENVLNLKEVDGDKIRSFDQAIGVNVSRSRFLPLNATSDLLLLRSDLYSFAEGVLVRNTERANPVDPFIHLGPEFQKVEDFLSRIKSIPSILGLDILKVTGDVWFGAGITLKGRVNIVAKPGMKLEIPDGAVIENKEINSPEDI